MSYLKFLNCGLSNTQIKEYIDKRYKSKKYRNILKERIIDGKTLQYLVRKYYGDDISPKKIQLLEIKISNITHKFVSWVVKELTDDGREEAN
jgi:hypothetical protein